MFHILFDDIRNLNGMDFIVRTSGAMLEFIRSFDTTGHFLYMDNDIGDKNIEGHHVLRRLLTDGHRPAHVYLVTSNVVAREIMAIALEHAGYVKGIDGLQFSWPIK